MGECRLLDVDFARNGFRSHWMIGPAPLKEQWG